MYQVVVYALFKLPNITKLMCVPYQTTYVILFQLQLVWLEEVKDYL
jgi:hypothetical protein